METFFETAAELQRRLDKKELSAVELARAVMGRTRAVDGRVKAFLGYDEAATLAAAQASDERRAKGCSRGPLDGIPVSIKNLVAVKGQPLTCASRILEHYVSPYSATVIEHLEAAGAVLWGWLNMDEFAMGSSTENSGFFPTGNPWDLSRTPGGSSGGSAAAVAAGETILALGSDTGGSIRQPAALCGIVGLKPTYGRVSRYGLVAFASSLDQIGPLSRSVRDAATLLKVLAGHDSHDSTSCQVEVPDYAAELDKPFSPKRIGVPKEYFGDGLDGEIRKAIEEAIEYFKKRGCTIVEVSLPSTDLAIPVYYLTATAEASSNLARFDGIRYSHRSKQATNSIDIYLKSRGEGFSSEVKRRIMLGTFVLTAGHYDAYVRAQKVRTLIRNDMARVFEKVDVLLTPTTPTPAFKLGEKSSDPIAMYLNDIYTTPANLAGVPGLSLPCGFTKQGLPIGFQLVGKAFAEAEILALGHAYECDHLNHKHPVL